MEPKISLDESVAGKIENIEERKIDGLDITMLSLRAKDKGLHTIYSDDHNLGYFFVGQEIEVWRNIVDSKKGIVIVEQNIGYRNQQGVYTLKSEYQEYP